MEKQKKIYWQPDLAGTVIYWSLTFASLFFGITGILETLRLPWISVVLFLIFIILGFFGLRRNIIVDENVLIIRGLFGRVVKTIALSNLDKISVGRFGFSFCEKDNQKPTEVLMMKKIRAHFFETLKDYSPGLLIEDKPKKKAQ